MDVKAKCAWVRSAKDWLRDDASDYSVARRILFSYHPLEPEMWLTVAQEQFPQISYGGTLLDFFVPTPDVEDKPKLLKQYEQCKWRRAEMTLLEFLRKTHDNGDLVLHLHESTRS